MYERYLDNYSGKEKGDCKTCGGIIKMPLKEFHIRDRIYYLRLFNRKGVKSHESIIWAGDMVDAEGLYQKVKDTLPKHKTYEIGEYYGTEEPIPLVS